MRFCLFSHWTEISLATRVVLWTLEESSVFSLPFFWTGPQLLTRLFSKDAFEVYVRLCNAPCASCWPSCYTIPLALSWGISLVLPVLNLWIRAVYFCHSTAKPSTTLMLPTPPPQAKGLILGCQLFRTKKCSQCHQSSPQKLLWLGSLPAPSLSGVPAIGTEIKEMTTANNMSAPLLLPPMFTLLFSGTRCGTAFLKCIEDLPGLIEEVRLKVVKAKYSSTAWLPCPLKNLLSCFANIYLKYEKTKQEN